MSVLSAAESGWLSDWTPGAPRPELAPAFARDPAGGRVGDEALHIASDDAAKQGYWVRSHAVRGGTWIRFRAQVCHQGVALPRRSVCARLLWAGAGNTDVRPQPGAVRRTAPSVWPQAVQLYGDPARGIGAEEEFPAVLPPGADGWSEVTGTYLVPPDAVRMAVELNLQYAAGGKVAWSGVTVEAVPEPPRRTARVAAVNFEPSGGADPFANCRLAEPFVAQAAAQGAQLVVFSEHYATQNLDPAYGLGRHVKSAEAIPGGPLCAAFGELARKHRVYLVVGMYEREGNSIYNDAVLFGPDGAVVGKYRKTTPTPGEMGKGIRPGDDFPVFDLPFAKVGMMVCWDSHFPEPARELARRGAEIIALPAYGFQTTLGQARAIENQVHLVASIYVDDGRSDPLHRWGISGVIDPTGKVVARAPGPQSVVVHEIDLTPRHWVWLGNLRERLPMNYPQVNGR